MVKAWFATVEDAKLEGYEFVNTSTVSREESALSENLVFKPLMRVLFSSIYFKLETYIKY